MEILNNKYSDKLLNKKTKRSEIKDKIEDKELCK